MRRLLTLACAALASAGIVPATALPPPPLNRCGDPQPSADAPAWMQAMPAPRETTVTRDDVYVRSRDGTRIAARVYVPDAYEPPLPAVFIFSPYWSSLGIYSWEREDLRHIEYPDCIIAFLLKRGYAVVIASMRGTHNSDGCFDYGGPRDQADGAAVVDWIDRRAWSNHRVGMYGVSHVGMSQYATAVAAPRALTAIIPIAPVTSFYRYLHAGGVRYETNLLTPPAYEGVVAAPPPADPLAPNLAESLADTACSVPNLARLSSLEGTMDRWFKARDYPSRARRIRAAVFHVHGTLDENVKTDHFAAMWEALEEAGVPRKALIGPWGHSTPSVPDWPFVALRWFEHWLRLNDTGMMAEPVLTLIDQMGQSRAAATFPPAGTVESVLGAGGGLLAPSVPAGTATYRDVPWLQRPLTRTVEGARLIYRSDPLPAPLRVSGTATFEVVASTDVEDTNFAVHLNEVGEGGFPEYVTRGYLDARHREGLDRARPVAPGVALRYRVELHAREYVFSAGSRIEVVLSSSDSCHWGVVPACQSSGIVSDATAGAISVSEGPGLTRLILPVAPLE